MKLATLKNAKRDGALIVVNRQLTKGVMATQIASTLQAALDDWENLAPPLQTLSNRLNDDKCEDAFPLDNHALASPLPRAYQWADGSAYVSHVELVRKARGAEMPENFWHSPLLYQGGSDYFLGPHDPICVRDESWGVDFEAEVAVITGDVPMGASPETISKNIHLIMLVNDVSLRNLIPEEMAKGFGFYQSKPASAFSPVAVTIDECGDAWDGKKLHLPLVSTLNGERFGWPNAGVDMTFDFPTLIAHASKTRDLKAGSIIGSGTVSNLSHNVGSSCIAERRMLEKLQYGEIKTPFMQDGDVIQIEMLNAEGESIFGAIKQIVKMSKP